MFLVLIFTNVISIPIMRFCDVYRYCTSIVAQNEKGEIWHARNLDYEATEILRNITIVVHFQRGSKVISEEDCNEIIISTAQLTYLVT